MRYRDLWKRWRTDKGSPEEEPSSERRGSAPSGWMTSLRRRRPREERRWDSAERTTRDPASPSCHGLF
jgi:hypothetical protein